MNIKHLFAGRVKYIAEFLTLAILLGPMSAFPNSALQYPISARGFDGSSSQVSDSGTVVGSRKTDQHRRKALRHTTANGFADTASERY